MITEALTNSEAKSGDTSIEKQAIDVTVASLENETEENSEIHDKAFSILKGHIEEAFTEEENKKVRRKIDLRILPLITLVYGMNYVDKAALSWAVMFNLKKDIHIDGNQYSWISAIFYFGYLGAEYPANYIIHKFSVSKIICIVCLVWGVLLFGHVGVKNYGGMLVIRFLLGVSEAPISAACINYVGGMVYQVRATFQIPMFCFRPRWSLHHFFAGSLRFGPHRRRVKAMGLHLPNPRMPFDYFGHVHVVLLAYFAK